MAQASPKPRSKRLEAILKDRPAAPPVSQRAQLLAIEKDLKELGRRRTENALAYYEPYPKQREFHALGRTKKERLLKAGNRLGKTFSGGAEAAYHLTGQYPDWWQGRRFAHPITMLAGSETAELTRKGVQRILIGPPAIEKEWGTGSIPKAAIADTSRRNGVPDALDTVVVRHASGGKSILSFLSYDQGREKWQADQAHVVWFDEEPPEDIYSEGFTRTVDVGGIVFMTFTPLKGMSNVVKRFLNEDNPDRAVVNMTMQDAKHMTPEKIREALSGYPAHEREARANGVPMQGTGRIFPCSEEMISEDAVHQVPAHWALLWGIDFGGGSQTAHPFGAVFTGWDRDADCLHIMHAVRMKDARPLDHSAAMKPLGPVPVAWPHDGHVTERGSGKTYAEQYRAHGLKMLDTHATFEDGGYSTEAGVLEMYERMTTGRLKVARHLAEWFEEFRMYHRDDGKIVKKDDDLLSATRMAVMMKRYAKPRFMFESAGGRAARAVQIADGTEYEVLGL